MPHEKMPLDYIIRLICFSGAFLGCVWLIVTQPTANQDDVFSHLLTKAFHEDRVPQIVIANRSVM